MRNMPESSSRTRLPGPQTGREINKFDKKATLDVGDKRIKGPKSNEA